MGLFGRNKATVGLDIGSGLIKVVEITHGSGEPVLSKVAFTALADDAIVEGEIIDTGVVADAVKHLFASAGIKSKSVVIDRKSTRLNSSHIQKSRMPSSA